MQHTLLLQGLPSHKKRLQMIAAVETGCGVPILKVRGPCTQQTGASTALSLKRKETHTLGIRSTASPMAKHLMSMMSVLPSLLTASKAPAALMLPA